MTNSAWSALSALLAVLERGFRPPVDDGLTDKGKGENKHKINVQILPVPQVRLVLWGSGGEEEWRGGEVERRRSGREGEWKVGGGEGRRSGGEKRWTVNTKTQLLQQEILKECL